MKIRKRSTWEITEGDNTFEVQFEPVDDSAIVKIDGDTAKVGYLSPCETSLNWYFDDRDEGEFHSFDRNVKHYEPFDLDNVMELVRQNPRRCFWIAKYEHSGVRYYRTGDAITLKALRARQRPGTEPSVSGLFIPDQQWDVSEGAAVYVVPKDATKPAEYCDAVMKEFSDWCNGAIYGVITQRFTKNKDGEWEPGDSDECWEYIGYDYATESLKEEMK